MIQRRDLMLAVAAAGSTLPVFMSASAASSSEESSREKPRADQFALALGGGAAKGFAHIPVLEAMDELGVRPAEIVGTSMGAILGSFYASGLSGREIRDFTVELFTRKSQLFQKLFLTDGRTWSSLLNVGRPAIIDPVVLFETVFPSGLAEKFSDLDIPVKIIATDFYTQSEVVLEKGPLLPAIAASSALPMLLTPVEIDGRVLIDGGFVNPSPFDVLRQDGYLSIAVDVTGAEFVTRPGLPSGMETWIGSFSITLHSLVAAKLACTRPDLLIEPPVGRFKAMDFFKIEDILAAAEPAKDTFKRGLEALWNQP
ncbi:patatin-like phospholipase family protein [Roseibium sediminicola]|uniref:Patatin-like phospholipase family protein n=1 Tax=Roseibium sediminicola TaxID=2933272 RepID=A0ABT0GPR5_9HYPH|nr:patatin-like phospholipase family protein [Roseibium sp. CAU 1639]MCK7611420.1 patatin-like phospholipase family protein [Roseibium sp. CAU 1639]